VIVTGEGGCVQLRRRTGQVMESKVDGPDVDMTLKRFSFDGAESNVITGDRLELATNDPRGLIFIPPSWWADNRVHHNVSFYAHVNSMGGLRMFRTFNEAINNDKDNACEVIDFTGAPIAVTAEVSDIGTHPLGGVAGYTFNTDRSVADVTALGDLFSEQFSAGTISGSGSFDCYFQVEGGMCAVTGQQERELSMVLPQLLLRADLGGEFDAVLVLAAPTPSTPIFYEVTGVITRSAVTVRPGGAVDLAVDFVTTGEFGLRIGKPSGYLLKEQDFDRIMREQDLDFLLTGATD
jgi:hypothetical protein